MVIKMNPLWQAIIAAITSILGCSGVWAFILKRSDKKSAESEMLRGLAHDRIIYLGMDYIKRGYITQDEYENLVDYLYKPYKKLGGNGSAERIIEEVRVLPIKHK